MNVGKWWECGLHRAFKPLICAVWSCFMYISSRWRSFSDVTALLQKKKALRGIHHLRCCYFISLFLQYINLLVRLFEFSGFHQAIFLNAHIKKNVYENCLVETRRPLSLSWRPSSVFSTVIKPPLQFSSYRIGWDSCCFSHSPAHSPSPPLRLILLPAEHLRLLPRDLAGVPLVASAVWAVCAATGYWHTVTVRAPLPFRYSLLLLSAACDLCGSCIGSEGVWQE